MVYWLIQTNKIKNKHIRLNRLDTLGIVHSYRWHTTWLLISWLDWPQKWVDCSCHVSSPHNEGPWYKPVKWRTNVYVLTNLAVGGLWTSIDVIPCDSQYIDLIDLNTCLLVQVMLTNNVQQAPTQVLVWLFKSCQLTWPSQVLPHD